MARGLLWPLVLISLACSAKEGSPGSGKQPGLVQEKSATLSRPSLVEQADRLALSATRTGGNSATSLWLAAAQARELAFRLEARKVDLLEAKEMLALAKQLAGTSSCEVWAQNARLSALENPDPEALYRMLYLAKQKMTDAACGVVLDQALLVLSAFEPSPEELHRLRESGEPEKAGAASSSSTSGSVVVSQAGDLFDLREPAKITKVEPLSAEQTARIVVSVTRPTKFQVGGVPAEAGRGPRIFVDIERASFEAPAAFESHGLVEGVRLGQQKDGTRVVMDLREVAYHRVFYLPDPFRLVIDLSTRSPGQTKNPREIKRIVLDPGHGGHDPGAVGENGLREKDVTLDIAHRAAPVLAREVGVSTLLTRDLDVFVPLDERAARANAFHADLFVSIHMNSSENASTRGVMTFVLDASRDATAGEIAARENHSTQAAATELANSLSQIESSDRRAASELFAQLLQKSAGASLRQKYSDVEDHGVRRAGFYVLAGAVMPAVLFEGSFLSNPVEAARLNSDAYRQRLADAIVNAVRAYKEGY